MRKNIWNIFFNLIRHIVNQGLNEKDLLTTIWSLNVLILSSCISAGILSSLVDREVKNINTIEELIDSDLTVLISNKSFLWWNFRHKRNSMRNYLKILNDLNRIAFFDEKSNDIQYIKVSFN